MTIIASAFTDTEFAAVSDALLSYSSPTDDPPLSLPIAGINARQSTAGGQIAALTSKAVVLGPDALLLWAGLEVVALAVTRDLASLPTLPTTDEFPRFLASLGLSEQELESCAFIYHRAHEGRLQLSYMNCEVRNGANGRVVAAGTGAFDFIDDAVLHADEGSIERVHSFLMEWIFRVAHALERELRTTSEPIHYAYGGWYEIVLWQSGRFRKLPYGAAFWAVKGDVIALLQTNLYWPMPDGQGVVGRFAYEEAGAVGELTFLPTGQGSAPETVGEMLAGYEAPQFFLHIIKNVEGVPIALYSPPTSMSVAFADGGVILEPSPETVERLRDAYLLKSLPTSLLERPYSDPSGAS